MSTSQDSQFLINHAYTSLTTRIMREGKLVEPAGAASVFLRHFDVHLGTPDNAPLADGWVDRRKLWVTPSLVAGWLSRHKVMRERRVNGWMRLTGAAQAFLIELVTVAMRGEELSGDDHFSLGQAIKPYPVNTLVQRELTKPHRIVVLSNEAFYNTGEMARAVATLRADNPALWNANWQALLFASWEKRGIGASVADKSNPGGIPEQDVSVLDRARWIAHSLTVPVVPDIAAIETNHAQVIAEGFSASLSEIIQCAPPLPAFVFENRAHAYREAVERQASKVTGDTYSKIFSVEGKLKPGNRFHCVLSGLDALEKQGIELHGHEEALVAGLANLDRQE